MQHLQKYFIICDVPLITQARYWENQSMDMLAIQLRFAVVHGGLLEGPDHQVEDLSTIVCVRNGGNEEQRTLEQRTRGLLCDSFKMKRHCVKYKKAMSFMHN
jgi:lysozyme family protein